MVYDFYSHLPTCYEDYEDICLPKHESMREKTRREGVYGYHYHWNKDAYTWVDRFLEDSVGKKFDKQYERVSKLCPNIVFEHVKGHNGDKWNEYCDKLATTASKRV